VIMLGIGMDTRSTKDSHEPKGGCENRGGICRRAIPPQPECRGRSRKLMTAFLLETEEANAMPGLLDELSKRDNDGAKKSKRSTHDVPSAHFVENIMRDGVFSHSNRVNDGRNTVVVSASYGRLGDVNAKNTLGEAHRDIRANAADIPKLKTLVAAGLLLTDASESINRDQDPHPLDKSVLFPVEGGYIDVRPKTPAYLPVAMRQSIYASASELLSASIRRQAATAGFEPKKLRYPVLSLRARSWKIPEAQNLSFYSNVIGGQVVHSLFLPPPQRRTDAAVLRKLGREWDEQGFSTGLLRSELSNAFEYVGIPLRIAHQKHRHKDKNEAISTMAAIDNLPTREAFVDLGRYAGMISRETLTAIPLAEGSKAFTERTNILSEHENPNLINGLWNMIVRHANKDDAVKRFFDHFAQGFSESFWFNADSEIMPPASGGDAKQSVPKIPMSGGKFLSISMKVDAHDAGTAGPSLSIPAPTAMFGFLHRVIERGVGLRMKRFMPIIRSCRLQDQLAQRHGIRIKLTEKAKKRLTGLDVSALQSATISPDELVISPDEMPHAIIGKSTPTHASCKNKAVSPPVQNEIKASTDMTLVVELETPVTRDEAESLTYKLRMEIHKAHLAGGIIHDLRVRFDEKEPKHQKGFILVRHCFEATNPLHELMQSVAFVEREYQGTWPLGMLACGYEGIKEAVPMRRKGETYPAQHAETIYKGFRFAGASHPDPVWFALECVARENLVDIQLCQ